MKVYIGEFSELTDGNQIFRNDFVCIYYNLWKLSTLIIKCIIFVPYDFMQLTLHNTIHYMA